MSCIGKLYIDDISQDLLNVLSNHAKNASLTCRFFTRKLRGHSELTGKIYQQQKKNKTNFMSTDITAHKGPRVNAYFSTLITRHRSLSILQIGAGKQRCSETRGIPETVQLNTHLCSESVFQKLRNKGKYLTQINLIPSKINVHNSTNFTITTTLLAQNRLCCLVWKSEFFVPEFRTLNPGYHQ